MSKGLEELEKAKKRTGLPLNQEFAPVTEKEIAIIEQELKEHEQYKATEEDLGINLLTFVKVLKAPEIYVKRKNEIFEVLHCDIRWDIVVNSIAIVLEESKNHTLYSIYHLRDYGKTWALTKEELL